MRPCKNIIFIINISGMLLSNLFAQSTNIKFEHIGLELGLSQSSVYTMTQDSQGFMWFGTQDGLNRYDGYNIKLFRDREKNSISYNVIWSLFTDSEGIIWIGTERGGVDLYNPQSGTFLNYKHNPNDSNSISENFITVIYEDSRKNLWIGTNSQGLNFFNRDTKKFLRIYSGESKYDLAGNSIRAICEDGQDNLWIGTSSGLSKLNLNDFYSDQNKSQFTNYHYNPKNKNSLSSNDIWALYLDSKKRLWIGTWGGGLNLYDYNKDIFIRYSNDPKNHFSLPSNYIKTIIEIADDSLWLGTYDSGLVSFNLKANRFYKQNIKDFILTFYKDKAGSIWIGTYTSGIKSYSSRKNIFKNYYEDNTNNHIAQNKNVSAIFETNDGELLVGTYGNGLEHFNKDRTRFIRYLSVPNQPNTLSNNRITAITQSEDGIIWIATNGGGLNQYDRKSKKFLSYLAKKNFSTKSPLFNQISTLSYDKKNNMLYLGYFNGGISSFDITEKKFYHFTEDNFNRIDNWESSITTIHCGEKTGIWVANYEGELFRLKKENNLFFKIDLPLTRYKDVKNAIYTLKEAGDSVLWMGTYGNGLYKFNLKLNELDIFNEENSDVNSVIYGFLDDDNGNLWCSSNKGIIRFNIHNKSVKVFDMGDGLQSNEFNQGAYFKSKRGELFFGGVNGFNSFFPEQVIDNEYIPPVFITSFLVFNNPLEFPNPLPENIEIQLSYNQNSFSFEFVALNFILPEKNKYRYELEGFDKDWHYVNAKQRYGIYTNLDPGSYILKVNGSNNDGIWNETGSSIRIIIKPPFWMSWWFKGIGIFLLLTLIFIFYKQRIATLEKEKLYQQKLSSQLIERQEEERLRIAQEMHDTLGQDILFIKNRALLTMQKHSDNTKVKEHLKLISDTASVLLNKVREISHNLRPPELDRLGLTETLKSLLQKLRDSTPLIVIGEIDDIDNLIDKKQEINIIRIVQEALNNILKHSEATECRVTITKTNTEIVLDIYDNGKGFRVNILKESISKSMGIGITGIIERVRILKGNIQIISNIGEGTHIKIKIPFSNKELNANQKLY